MFEALKKQVTKFEDQLADARRRQLGLCELRRDVTLSSQRLHIDIRI